MLYMDLVVGEYLSVCGMVMFMYIGLSCSR